MTETISKAVQLVWIGVCVCVHVSFDIMSNMKVNLICDGFLPINNLLWFMPCILAQNLHVQGLFISITHFRPFAGDARLLDTCPSSWSVMTYAGAEQRLRLGMHALLWRDLNTCSKTTKNKVTRTIHKAPPENRKSLHVIELDTIISDSKRIFPV